MSKRSSAGWRLMAGVLAALAVHGGCASAGGGAHEEALPDARTVAELELVDVEGRPHRLSELRGQVVLLDFWATWCAPCLESLPLYETWQKDLGDKGLVVVAVSVDEEDAPVAEFAKRYAPSVKVLRDAEGVAASRLGLPKMPTAFVIDRDGAVVERRAGFDQEEAAALRASIERRLETP